MAFVSEKLAGHLKDENPPLELSDEILDSCEDSKFDPDIKKFLPAGCLDKLLTAEAVFGELLDGDELDPADSELSKIVTFACGKGQKVFATTIFSGHRGNHLIKAMQQFIEVDFLDSSLPFKEGKFLRDPFFRKDRSSPWRNLKIHHFCKFQWMFLSPVFSQQYFKVDLYPEDILPFTEKNDSPKEGAFGQVYEVQIHPAHHINPVINPDGSPAKLAIKEFILPPNDDDLQQEAEAVWRAEVDTLDEISGLSHPNLIQRIAAITRGRQRCLMFLWADGGNLRDFWRDHPKPEMTAKLVKEMVEQLRGMAEALQKLHTYNDHYHIRHGDIKSENILNFPVADRSRIGIFKISDLGSAKHHSVATRLRERTGGKAFATTVYQPPESITNRLSASSRLYDIWSMGCVTLEFMVWLLYGYEELQKFNATIVKQDEPCSFFVTEPTVDGTGLRARIHPAVQARLDSLSLDPECQGDTALEALLDIVRTKLLVVALPEKTESSFGELSITNASPSQRTPQLLGNHRASAQAFVNSLDEILKGRGSRKDSYWFTGQNRENVLRHRIVPSIVIEDNAPASLLSLEYKPRAGPFADRTKAPAGSSPSVASSSLVIAASQSQNIQDLSDDWVFPIDNTFATRLLQDMGGSISPREGSNSSFLCRKCKDMDFWHSRFRIEDKWSELEGKKANCDFCRMRWEVSNHLERKDFPFITFERKDSTLRMNDSNSPIISIVRSPVLRTPTEIQIGFPQLPQVGTDAHFKILRLWLKNCDDNHQKFKCQPSKTSFLPTRLIDVRDAESGTVRLRETKSMDHLRYIALSHPWGQNPPYHHFCTFLSNVEEFKRAIKIADLPATFKDAVTTTRELGIQYLWIDSICIIQGKDGDFDQESQRMENVFSSAYCVLAASSAKGQSDGFLKQRRDREFVTFRREGQAPFYLCRSIDDFNQHVLLGALNKRGWVMQERVLAHRTIYFTSKQTYWECGECVRCETLTRMENKLASFLSDPNFPDRITSRYTNKGERITFYQNLYRQYSRLTFTHWEDRPVAIAGLERRLIYDLKTYGGFGVFDDSESLLRRSLLWRRGKGEVLRKIMFPPERHIAVPTWSWMAYQGGIDFLELPLGGVEWLEGEVSSPWLPKKSQGNYTAGTTKSLELNACARDFEVQKYGEGEVEIDYDIPKTEGQVMRCVVMGKRKEQANLENARHYVLFLTPKGGANVYERVGVGYMPGRFIHLAPLDSSRLVKVR